MTREWKPGDVALRKGRFGNYQLALFTTECDNHAGGSPHFHNECGGFDYADSGMFHPLVVIDPEDDEQVDRLAEELYVQGIVPEGASPKKPDDVGIAYRKRMADRLQAALREFANPTPPKPDEPTGLGAVVEDDEHRLWIRHSNTPGSFPWLREGHGVEGWSNINAVRILSDGVQP